MHRRKYLMSMGHKAIVLSPHREPIQSTEFKLKEKVTARAAQNVPTETIASCRALNLSSNITFDQSSPIVNRLHDQLRVRKS